MSRAGGRNGGAGKAGFNRNETPQQRTARIKANRQRRIEEWEREHPGQSWTEEKLKRRAKMDEAAAAQAHLKKEEAIEDYLHRDEEVAKKKISEKNREFISTDEGGIYSTTKTTILQKVAVLYRKYAYKFRMDSKESEDIEKKYRAYKDGSSKDYSLDDISEELRNHKQSGDKIRVNIMEEKELNGMSEEEIYLIIDVINHAAIDYKIYNPDGRGRDPAGGRWF